MDGYIPRRFIDSTDIDCPARSTDDVGLRVIAVCNDVFLLSIFCCIPPADDSGDIRDQSVKLSEIVSKF